ncbi:hypothetical protein L7F22_061015 [Adiantum nelumboides]|nr:hypothetical protein [Adiantum nelumboides]
MWNGPRLHDFLAANLNGPSLSTTKRDQRLATQFLPGIHGYIFDAIGELYQKEKEKHGIQSQIPFILVEDETAIKKRIRWNPKDDTLVGFDGYKMENHERGTSSLIKVGAGKIGYDMIVKEFENHVIGGYARVFVANPLHEALPCLVLGKGHWCTPYVPFERKTVFCMTKAQAHEVYDLPISRTDDQLLIEADFTNKDWLKCFKEVPKRGSKVKCRDVKPELWNRFYVLFTSVYQEPPRNYGMEVTKGFAKGFLYEQLKGQVDWALFLESIVTDMDPGKLHAKKQRWVAFHSSFAPNSLRRMTRTPDHLEVAQETTFVDTVDDVQKKNLFSAPSLTELDSVYNMVVSKHSFALSKYNEAFKKLELLQADVHQNEEVEHFTKVEFASGNKCEKQNSKVLVHDEKEDVLDKDDEVEIVGGYNCEEQDPKVEVHVEKKVVLEKYIPENGDQAENFPSSMKDSEVSARDTNPSILQTIQMMQRERKRKMTVVISATRKLTKDEEGQTKTSKDQLEKETGENSNMESGRKDAATSNVDNLDHIISTIAKSTLKDPPNIDTSFRVEGQVPCANNIKGQEDKNTKFVVISTAEDTEIIMKRFEPPEENDDASVDAGGDASCAGGAVGAGDDTEIITDKYEPPWEDGDASVDVGGAVGASEDTDIIIEKFESPQEDGDASVDIGGEGSCADGAIGASDDMEMIIENSKPPQGDDDASVDAGGDGSCATGGVAGYVSNDDGTLSRPWEDPGNILFESKPALILDINGVLLTLVDKKYCSHMPAYWNDLEIVDRAGVFAGYKRDAPAFLDWCLVHFDVFVWTCCMKNKAKKILRACFPDQFRRFKEVLAQHDCVRDARFKITGGKPVFYKKLSDFWETRGQYTATSTILVDDTQSSCGIL